MNPTGNSNAEASSLLPLLFAPMASMQRVRILDVGPAMPQTVAFCKSTGCERLYIADLMSGKAAAQQYDLNQVALVSRFKEDLSMVDAPVDICLLWDFPNHLTRPALEAFNQALSALIKPSTSAHAFCAVNQAKPMVQHRYSINSLDSILLHPDAALKPAAHPYSQKQLISGLNLFEVERGTLRQGARVELLLRAHTQGPPRFQY